ncbi:MAG TPA: CHAT domain-containing protein [Anaerolineales bacterium]|nr:CHAT domain-containing protein [Anaerolineales bacterium]
MPFQNFDLLITDSPPAARVTDSYAGRTPSATPLGFDPEDILARFERIRQRINVTEGDLNTLGRDLFVGLFTGEIIELFFETKGAVGTKGGVHIRLVIESPRLARLPWELIYTRREGFLAANPDFSVVRYLPVPQPVQSIEIELPLRILVVISAPSDLPPLDYEAEQQAFLGSIEAMLANQGVEVHFEFDATHEKLLTHVQSNRFHVLHFIGHGDYADGQGVIFLEDPKNLAASANASQFAEIINAGTSLRLTVLNACSSAQEGALDGFSGIANQLIGGGIPAVIAMRNEASDRIAISFTRHLYGNLAGGESVGLALAHTRQQLRLESASSPVAFANPILHLHSPDGVLFRMVSSRRQNWVRVTQQIIALNEASKAMVEWKNLHDILQTLVKQLDFILDIARNPAGESLVRSMWDSHFKQTINARLIPFASERIQYIGRRYATDGTGSTGEEWAVKTLQLTQAVDEVFGTDNLSGLPEIIGHLRGLLIKHMTQCNRKMVGLLETVNRIFSATHTALEELNVQLPSTLSGGFPVNWLAIQEDLSALDGHNGKISEWIRLHDLFDRLHIQFAIIASSAPLASSVELIAGPWGLLRDTILSELFDLARQISQIGKAFTELPDGSLRGEPWARDIKQKSNLLDAKIKERNVNAARETIATLGRLIEQYYLEVDRKILDEMSSFTQRTATLHGRVNI